MASEIAYRFISAHDHIDLRWLPKDLWTERLPGKLRQRGPRVVENEKGSYWTWEGQTFRPHGYYTAAQGSGAMWAIERAGVMRKGELRPTIDRVFPIAQARDAFARLEKGEQLGKVVIEI